MGPSIYQRDLGTKRKWKIRLCQEIRTQYPTYDDPNTGSHLVVLLRIPDFIRNRRWSLIRPRTARLRDPGSRKKTLDRFGRAHGRNRPKGGFTIYEKESPQKYQCHVHRSEPFQQK